MAGLTGFLIYPNQRRPIIDTPAVGDNWMFLCAQVKPRSPVLGNYSQASHPPPRLDRSTSSG